MNFKLSIKIIFGFGLVSMLAGCKTRGMSETKDVGVSAGDLAKRHVVFLNSGRVYRGECPSNGSLVNRNCSDQNIVTIQFMTSYQAGLHQTLLNQRAGGNPNTPPASFLESLNAGSLQESLEQDISRSESELASLKNRYDAMVDSGVLSDAKKLELESKLAELNGRVSTARSLILSADEKARFNEIMKVLKAEGDITIDSGESIYNLAIAAFGPSVDSPLNMTFVKIPDGKFMMGSSGSNYSKRDESPQHQVTISQEFEMQTTEVTQAQWVSVMRGNPLSGRQKSENCPGEYAAIGWLSICPNNAVVYVNGPDIQAFIRNLNNRKDGYIYRLPTEAEWEYAARAGVTEDEPANIKSIAWCCGYNEGQSPRPVGKKEPNAWGLYDMLGNVSERTNDWGREYSKSPVTDPVGYPSSDGIKGCSFDSNVFDCRFSARASVTHDHGHYNVGFRLMRMKR